MKLSRQDASLEVLVSVAQAPTTVPRRAVVVSAAPSATATS